MVQHLLRRRYEFGKIKELTKLIDNCWCADKRRIDCVTEPYLKENYLLADDLYWQIIET